MPVAAVVVDQVVLRDHFAADPDPIDAAVDRVAGAGRGRSKVDPVAGLVVDQVVGHQHTLACVDAGVAIAEHRAVGDGAGIDGDAGGAIGVAVAVGNHAFDQADAAGVDAIADVVVVGAALTVWFPVPFRKAPMPRML